MTFGIMISAKLSISGKVNENILKNGDSGENQRGVGLTIDSNAQDKKTAENKDEEQGVSISGRDSITIPANKKEITVDFYNPEENTGLYYLTFELRLYNNSVQGYEVLYTSELVEPGRHINHITISHGLKNGVYDAVIHVQPYRMNEEKALTNNADMKTKLIVK